MKRIKRFLALFLAFTMIAASGQHVYATETGGAGSSGAGNGTASTAKAAKYVYNWEGETEVTHGGTVETAAPDNEITLVAESGNQYVKVQNVSGADANIKADISNVDPTKPIVIEVSLYRGGDLPPIEIAMAGTDDEGNPLSASLMTELSAYVRSIGNASYKFGGVFTKNKWNKMGFVINPQGKTVDFYLYDAENDQYVKHENGGTYSAEFATLKDIVVGATTTTTQTGRYFYIDDLKVYNSSSFAKNVTITTKESATETLTGYDLAVLGEDYTYTLPTAEEGFIYSVEAVTIGGTACTEYTVANNVLTIDKVTLNKEENAGDVTITVAKKVRNYSVNVVTKEEGAEDERSTGTPAVAGTDYIYTLPVEEGYTFAVTEVQIGENPYNGYSVAEGKLTIPAVAVSGDITIVITKSVTKPNKYEYNWDGKNDITYGGAVKVVASENEISLETGSGNQYVKVQNVSGGDANIQADISGVDPTKPIVIEVSIYRGSGSPGKNLPPIEISLVGTDVETDSIKVSVLKETSAYVTGLGDTDYSASKKFGGVFSGQGKWNKIGFMLIPESKTIELYTYNAETESYEKNANAGEYSAEFATLTNIVVGATATDSQKDRYFHIDNIRVYNGSAFETETVTPAVKHNVTVTTQEADQEDVVENAQEAVEGTDYAYVLPNVLGYAYSVTSVTIGGTAYTDYRVENGVLNIAGAAVTGDMVIVLTRTATGEEEETAVVVTDNNGNGLIEAENTTYSSDTNKVLKQDFANSSGSVLRMRTWYGTSPTMSTLEPMDSAADISFNIDVDEAGTYYLWAKAAYYNANNAYVWLSIDGSDYEKVSLRHGTNTSIFANPDEGNYGWKKLIEVEVTDPSKDVEVRIKPIRVGGSDANAKVGYAAAVDKFLITGNFYYVPADDTEVKLEDMPGRDEILIQTLPGDLYAAPPITPTAGTHPRMLFTAEDIPAIKANLTHAENAAAYAAYLANKDAVYDGILGAIDPSIFTNHSDEGLRIIEAKAFDYILNRNDSNAEVAAAARANGQNAVTALLNYLETYESVEDGNNYRRAGQVLLVGSEVYDWCYDLLSDTQKAKIVGAFQYMSYNYMEIGFPPNGQGSVTGHGSGTQFLRSWMAVGIATYDEYPDIYNFVAGRFFEEFVPARNYFYKSGGHYQGNCYGEGRFANDLWAQTFLCNMDGQNKGVNSVYAPETAQVAYQWIYSRRSDGQLLRDGDDTTERSAAMSGWYTVTNEVYFLAANFYKDGILKGEFLKDVSFEKSFDDLTSVQMLALNDPTIEIKETNTLPLTKYISSPQGIMIARTGWNMGVGAPDVLAHMKIGEVWVGNHIHRNAGSFQLYYKGILASESGAYVSYGDTHDDNYNKSSIAHNTLLITSQANPLGVQRMPNNDSEYSSIDKLIQNLDDCTTGEVIGQEFGPDIYTPEYTYIAGDVASAYDSNVAEAVRSMLFLPMDDEDHPAVFVVFDRITTAEAGSKKTFMLHMQNKPTISGNVTTIVNTDGNYNGMLTNQTLLPANAVIEAIGGKGKEFMVGDVNYETGNRVSTANMELGWGRVEISTTTEAANQTDYFLNVMYVNDADQTLAFEEAQLIEAANVIGAQIFDRVAVFNQKKERTGDVIAFEIPASDDVTVYKVNVAGLLDGTWTVTTGSGTQTAVATEDGGMLYFSAPAGICTLTRTGDANEKVFTENKPVVQNAGIKLRVNGEYLYEAVVEKIGEEIYLPAKDILAAANATVQENADGSVSIDYQGIKIDIADTLVPFAFLKSSIGDKISLDWNELCQLADVTIEKIKLRETYDWSDTYPNAIKVQAVTQLAEGGTSVIWGAVDGDLSTSWGTKGRDGTETGIFDLGRLYKLDEIMIAFHKGNEIVWEFGVMISKDGVTYVPVIQKQASSGSTTALESFDLNDVEARYVKMLGYGNKNGSEWNTLKEIILLGEAVIVPGGNPEQGDDTTTEEETTTTEEETTATEEETATTTEEETTTTEEETTTTDEKTNAAKEEATTTVGYNDSAEDVETGDYSCTILWSVLMVLALFVLFETKRVYSRKK